MKYKILADSSSNLLNNHIQDENVSFESVPMSVIINEKEYVDDENVNVEEILEKAKDPKNKSSSACPSPEAFLKRMTGADKYIIITVAEKLSGSYNSAILAKQLYSEPDNVFVIDSKLVAGSMELLVDKAYELIKQGKSFDEIQKELTSYRDGMKLLFILSHFDTFIKNGRINKVIGFIASTLHIKPVLFGSDGEIKLKDKCITMKSAISKLLLDIQEFAKNTLGKICIISHTKAEKEVKQVKEEIEKRYQFKEIRMRKNRGLCSYYSMSDALIVCF